MSIHRCSCPSCPPFHSFPHPHALHPPYSHTFIFLSSFLPFFLFSLLTFFNPSLPSLISSSPHLLISSSPHLLISSSLHLFTSSSLHLFISSPPHLFTSSPPHLFTSSSLHLFIFSSFQELSDKLGGRVRHIAKGWLRCYQQVQVRIYGPLKGRESSATLLRGGLPVL